MERGPAQLTAARHPYSLYGQSFGIFSLPSLSFSTSSRFLMYGGTFFLDNIITVRSLRDIKETPPPLHSAGPDQTPDLQSPSMIQQLITLIQLHQEDVSSLSCTVTVHETSKMWTPLHHCMWLDVELRRYTRSPRLWCSQKGT